MDVKQLPDDEQKAYLAIIDGYDVKIQGKKDFVIITKTHGDKNFEIFNPKFFKTPKIFKYPIDAFLEGCKIVNGFEKWSIENN